MNLSIPHNQSIIYIVYTLYVIIRAFASLYNFEQNLLCFKQWVDTV